MGKGEKRAYLEAIRKRYKAEARHGKKRILDEYCEVCSTLRTTGGPMTTRPPDDQSPGLGMRQALQGARLEVRTWVAAPAPLAPGFELCRAG
jgi:hypothetical protein